MSLPTAPRDLALVLCLRAVATAARALAPAGWRPPRGVLVALDAVAAAGGVFAALFYRHVCRIVFNRRPPASPAAAWRLAALTRPVESLWRLATAPLRCTPDVLILGEVRCGTTTVAGHLSNFPGARGPFCPWRVGFADGKESFYFVGHYLGLVHPFFYRMCFPFVWERWWARARGRPFFCYDACAQYLSAPWVPRLLKEVSPGARFVVCLRDPVLQNLSWWRFEHGSIGLGEALGLGRDWVPGREPPESLGAAFDASAASEPLWAEAERLRFRWRVPGWAATWPGGQLRAFRRLGDYATNVERWQAHFPSDRFCFVELKELSAEALPGALRRHYAPLQPAVERLAGAKYPHWGQA